jgi:acyl-CoA reductase-like NAD-dependent aldehyde dehydrogenase
VARELLFSEPMDGRLLISGEWTGGERTIVHDKFSNEPIGTMATARDADIEAAIAAADRSKALMAEMPAHRRSEILSATAARLLVRKGEIARILAREAGKPIKLARLEVDRAISTFTFAAEEAKRIHGETVPLDAVPQGERCFGFWIRRPLGAIAAIAPFNFPLNLVAHKVAPALAAGNSVVLKPALQTPLSSVLLCQCLVEAGLPRGAINLIHGPGPSVGAKLVVDPRIAKISFTGSRDVGRSILAQAGIKKVTLELGNSSPAIVATDADVKEAARRCALGAFAYSGQVCISLQRIYVERSVRDDFVAALVVAMNELVVANPIDERSDLGPMIDPKEATRVESWIAEAIDGGARVISGGRREGAVHWPTLLTDVTSQMKVVAGEAFGPVASIIETSNFEESLRLADATEHGLQAAVFTRDIDRVFRAIARLDFGGVVVNDAPSFRADHMPYGGNRQSGIGREGVRFAIEEMTNVQMVSIRMGGRQ